MRTSHSSRNRRLLWRKLCVNMLLQLTHTIVVTVQLLIAKLHTATVKPSNMLAVAVKAPIHAREMPDSHLGYDTA